MGADPGDVAPVFRKGAKKHSEAKNKVKSPFHEDDTKESFFDLYLQGGAGGSESDQGRELAAFAARRRVQEWLESIGMERYHKTFEDNGLGSLSSIEFLDENDLASLDIPKHDRDLLLQGIRSYSTDTRRRTLQATAALKQGQAAAAAAAEEDGEGEGEASLPDGRSQSLATVLKKLGTIKADATAHEQVDEPLAAALSAHEGAEGSYASTSALDSVLAKLGALNAGEAGAGAGAAEEAAVEAKTAAPASTGTWAEYYDEANALPYWYNDSSGVSTYDNPVATPTEQAPPPTHGFSEYYDEGSGLPYYYNEHTGESTYERPHT